MAVRKEGITRQYGGEHFLFSSYSRAGDECIGVAGATAGAVAHGAVAILDSKSPEGDVLEVSQGAWSAFVEYSKGQ